MKRLFVAVDLDQSVRAVVAEITTVLARRLRNDRGVRRITWVRTEHLHLTLRFLGDVDDADVSSLQAALAPPLASATFQLLFEGLGMFPPAGRPRVLWLGVKEGEADLRIVHDEIEGRLQSAGVAPDPRPFRSHLTLARFRDATTRPDLRALGVAESLAGPCRVDHVTLYESRLSADGPTHNAIAQAMLRGEK